MMNEASESGAYFKCVYADLLERLPEFPASDPAPNLRECIPAANFVRAEMLAKQHELPSEVITRLREMAVLQYVIDYRNFDGLDRLIEQFELTQSDITRILALIQEERAYPCFSFSKATEMAANENWSGIWQKEYAQPMQERIGKPSVLSRFAKWVKGLFVRERASI